MDARDGIVTVFAGAAEVGRGCILSEADAVVFANWFGEDPTRLMDLVNARIEGREEAKKWVRDALWYQVLGLGNSTRDTLNGIVNLIGNQGWLSTAPHLRSVPQMSCPAIAVGAGPSLAGDIEFLRENQRSCLIIASDSAVMGLRREGITPHLTTPVERDHYVERLISDTEGICYAGTGVVMPSVPARFKQHLAVPGHDPLSSWVDALGVGFGSSTGTMAVRVGLHLTTGPVFLVGHDLCWDGGTTEAGKHTHWTGSNAELHFDADESVVGNDGKMHPTSHWLMVYRDQIATMAMESERIFNSNIIKRTGAMIPGVKPAYLPRGYPAVSPQWTGEASEFRRAFPDRVRQLPLDIEACILRAEQATCMERLSMEALGAGGSRPAVETLLRPSFIQCSMERRLGMSAAATIKGMRSAVVATLQGSLATVRAAL